MQSVYLFGASHKALDFLLPLCLTFHIKGFIDSDEAKLGQKFMGLPVHHKSEIFQLKYDHIIITTSFEQEVIDFLNSLGITQFSLLTQLTNVIALYEENVAHTLSNNQLRSAKLPLIALQPANIKQAQLLVNRSSMLALLPKRGVVAEIGVAGGDFSRRILDITKPEKLYLVDYWGSQRYGDDLCQSVHTRFKNECAKNYVEIIRSLSTEAVSQFDDKLFDWIYIDTDHTYTTTKAELRLYAPKMKSGGIIAGHDYSMGNWDAHYRYGVIEAVYEFCSEFGFEFLYLTMDLSENQSFAIRKIV
jgi:hypothetical protein